MYLLNEITKTLISCAVTLICAFVFAMKKKKQIFSRRGLFFIVVQTAYDIRTLLSHSFRKLEAQKVVATAETTYEKGIIAVSVGNGARILY